MIASADPELFLKVKSNYLSKNKDLFIKNIFSAIINKNFEQLLEHNIIKEWKEYVLYALTYLKNTEFLQFAVQMGKKLQSSHDTPSAIICFILGRDYASCISLLHENYVNSISHDNQALNEFALQELFEEVSLIRTILEFGENQFHQETETIMVDYCNLLIKQNLTVEAYKYLSKVKTSGKAVLLERLYEHCSNKLAGNTVKPISPFEHVNVKKLVVKNKQEERKNPQLITNKNMVIYIINMIFRKLVIILFQILDLVILIL